MDIRYVQPYTLTTYLHRGDVAQYIFDLAAGEETDVRGRLEQTARNLLEVGETTGMTLRETQLYRARLISSLPAVQNT